MVVAIACVRKRPLMMSNNGCAAAGALRRPGAAVQRGGRRGGRCANRRGCHGAHVLDLDLSTIVLGTESFVLTKYAPISSRLGQLWGSCEKPQGASEN